MGNAGDYSKTQYVSVAAPPSFTITMGKFVCVSLRAAEPGRLSSAQAHSVIRVALLPRYAHHGMAGTELPPMDTGTVWQIGGKAEVTWQVSNNHGGGYSWRLCPMQEGNASEWLTEECFQAFQLDFDPAEQAIVTANGTLINISDKAVFVTEGKAVPLRLPACCRTCARRATGCQNWRLPRIFRRE